MNNIPLAKIHKNLLNFATAKEWSPAKFSTMKKNLTLLCLFLGLMSLAHPQQMPRLSPGDTIAIVSTASDTDTSRVLPFVRFMESKGFVILLADGLFDNDQGFAGPAEQRARIFQQLLDRADVKAIICARGGYGTVGILDRLNFTGLRQHPKWLCGFSDITALHSHLHTLGFPTLHSTMPVSFHADDPDNANNTSLLSALHGDTLRYSFEPMPENRCGTATGTLVGGNLSLLYSLLESPSSINTDGKILFIEDVDENIYHIHRMLMALDRAGKLKNLKGVIVGGMTRIRVDDYFMDETVNAAILRVFEKYDYPVCFNFPAGHGGENVALRLGVTATLTVAPDSCTLISLPQ